MLRRNCPAMGAIRSRSTATRDSAWTWLNPAETGPGGTSRSRTSDSDLPPSGASSRDVTSLRDGGNCGAARLQGTMESMTLTTFALVRHGQTDWNAERRLQGATDIPLNDVGRGQARDAVAFLSDQAWDTVVSSPLSRAAETARIIADGLGLKVARLVPELTERSFGPAEGLQAGPELEALRIPGGFRGGETDQAAADRGIAALESLAEEFAGKRVLVVAHGTLIRLTLSQAIGRTLDSVQNAVLNLAHHHVTDGWQLEYFNGERVTADVQP